MKFFSLSIILISYGLVKNNVYAQTINGTVKDSLNRPISYATVSVLNLNEVITTYALSNQLGNFKIELPGKLAPYALRVTAIGFKAQIKLYSNQNLNFLMLPEENMLKEVAIKSNKPILKKSGDTLSYRVSEFSERQDMVIADVIKRMPGITLDETGKISFNGKAISHFYIDGDDLLDDRYNIATRTVPVNAVDKVQVLQNHQAIRMLKGKIATDEIAVNLTMKEDAKLQWIGQAILGGGIPDKYDGNVNEMMFRKKFKGINYLKLNNVGTDISGDFTGHNLSEDINTRLPEQLLFTGHLDVQGLSTQRSLMNNSQVISINNLVNVRKEIQLKINVSYLHDNQKQHYERTTENYLQLDTISYTETQSSRYSPNNLQLKLNLNINTQKRYINNALIIEDNSTRQNLEANNNGQPLTQNVKQREHYFSNELNYFIPLKSGLIFNLYSHLARFQRPERLTLNPGLSYPFIDSDLNYSQIIQNIKIPTWIVNNNFALRIPISKINLEAKAGFSIRSQELISNLYPALQDKPVGGTPDSVFNDMKWLQKNAFMETGIDLILSKLALQLSVPLVFQQTDYRFQVRQQMHSNSMLYLNPAIMIKYQTGQESNLVFKYKFTNQTSDISALYQGYILKNYRSLGANYTDFVNQRIQTGDIIFNFTKAAKMFFFNLGLSYKKIDADFTTEIISTAEFERRITLQKPNSVENIFMNALISKYLFFLSTTVNFSPFIGFSKATQIQNEILIPFKTINNGFGVGVETKLNRSLSLSTSSNASYIKSASPGIFRSSFTQIRHKIVVNYLPGQHFSLKLSGEQFQSKEGSHTTAPSTFIDFSIKYHMPKYKIEFELFAPNLLNTKIYSNVFIDGNTYSRETYRLPGRILTGKIRFNF